MTHKIESVSASQNNATLFLYFSSGLHTYSNDERLSINFEQPNNWKLRIKAIDLSDACEYQCQVSTHPPIILVISLSVTGKDNIEQIFFYFSPEHPQYTTYTTNINRNKIYRNKKFLSITISLHSISLLTHVVTDIQRDKSHLHLLP